jgi:hypothetical protein
LKFMFCCCPYPLLNLHENEWLCRMECSNKQLKKNHIPFVI